jgi:thioredoxin reductase
MAVRKVEFVIVGGGVAAAKAAEGLRAAGGDGPAVLLAAEPELPYERPTLSKTFLRGETGRETTRTHDEAWYRDHQVELLLATRASTLDVATRTVTTELGDQLRYGRGLVLATGAQPVRLQLPGEDLEGVYHLRTVDDAERLRAAVSRAEHMVVIGGGFIGAEVAASATQMDTRVTLLEVNDTLWTGAVGSELGRFLEAFLRDRGVHVRTRIRAERLEGGDSVQAVLLPDGTRLHADLVVIGVGARPSGPACRSATACWSTGSCGPPRASGRPVTWPTSSIRCSGGSAPSTGPRPSTRGCWPAATWPEPATPTTACRTSTPSSLTCPFRSSGTPRSGTSCSSGAVATQPIPGSWPGTCTRAPLRRP